MRLSQVIGNKIYLYAEVLNDSTEVFFYFRIPTKEEFIYSNDIPKVYNVDRKIYKELLFELFDKFEELREEFKKKRTGIMDEFDFNNR